MLSRKQVMVAMAALGAFSILALAGHGTGCPLDPENRGPLDEMQTRKRPEVEPACRPGSWAA